MTTNLYKLTQIVNQEYDTYNSCIVAADSEQQARLIHPSQRGEIVVIDGVWHRKLDSERTYEYNSDWANPADIQVELIGTAAEHIQPGTVILTSFIAG